MFGIHISGDCPAPPQDDGGPPTPPPDQPGPPESEPMSEKSDSDESCTSTTTARNCQVDCTKVSQSGSTTVSCTSTSCSPTVGCSPTGTTTTSTTSSGSCGALEPPYSVPASPGPASTIFMKRALATDATMQAEPPSNVTSALARRTDTAGDSSCGGCMSEFISVPASASLSVTDEQDDLQEQKRDIAGRLVYRSIAKRAQAQTIANVGPEGRMCNLNTPSGDSVTIPAFPGGPDVLKSDLADKLAGGTANVPRWYTTIVEACSPKVTAIDAASYNRDANQQQASMDHSYELHWLKQFFANILDDSTSSNKVSCNDLNHYFLDAPKGGNTKNRLKPVYDALPSETNIKDFIGMAIQVNRAKGMIANVVGTGGLKNRCENQVSPGKKVNKRQNFNDAIELVSEKLATLQDIAMGCGMLNDRANLDNMIRTNKRIWQALQSVDEYVSCSLKETSVFSFADKFKEYMEALVTNKNAGMDPQARYWAARLIQVIGADLKILTKFELSRFQQTQLTTVRNKFNALKQLDDLSSASAWRITVKWNWSPQFQKRGDSCAAPSPSPSGSSRTSGGTGSLTGTGAGIGGSSPTGGSPGSYSPNPTSSNPYCVPFQDPDQGITSAMCQCSDSSTYFAMDGSEICGYSTKPPSSLLIASTPASPTTSAPPPTTTPSTTAAPTPTPTASLPASCTTTPTTIVPNEYSNGNPSCGGGGSSSSSDIFTCGSNSILFTLFAPGGTSHSNGQDSNDVGGWASFSGATCWCNNGNFCCNEGASMCLPINVNFFESFNDGPGAGEVEWYTSPMNGGQCSCNG
ncbi:MAG: hypothetical protein Q9165_006879 [Trypethelium subeluteriae]